MFYLIKEMMDTIKVAIAIISVNTAIRCDCIEDLRISFLKSRMSCSSTMS